MTIVSTPIASATVYVYDLDSPLPLQQSELARLIGGTPPFS